MPATESAATLKISNCHSPSQSKNSCLIVSNSSLIYGRTQKSTTISPARLVRNACSSLPLCLSTWLSTDTRIPTAPILKMIPTSSIVVPIYELICDLGLYDTQLALIIVYAAVNMPFVMWTMLSFYEGIPTTLDEAAYVDGASSLQTFRKVILPICTPGLATAFIFTLFLAWNDFLLALLLTSTNAKTFTVGLAGFLSAYNLDLGPMCAGAFLFSFPVMIISLAAQRYIVQGMTAGAVKG